MRHSPAEREVSWEGTRAEGGCGDWRGSGSGEDRFQSAFPTPRRRRPMTAGLKREKKLFTQAGSDESRADYEISNEYETPQSAANARDRPCRRLRR